VINQDDFAAWVGAPWPLLVMLMALAAVAAVVFGLSAVAILVSFALIFVLPVALIRVLRGRHRLGRSDRA
jgi:hypothetical protein